MSGTSPQARASLMTTPADRTTLVRAENYELESEHATHTYPRYTPLIKQTTRQHSE